MPEKRTFKVFFTAKFVTEVEVEGNQIPWDVIEDIDIPESSRVAYVPDSFEVQQVLENKLVKIPISELRK